MENLEDFSIHFLRDYARTLGIPYPSHFKKAQLIQEIQKMQNGELVPHFSNKGRPPKIQSQNQVIVARVKRLNNEEIIDDLTTLQNNITKIIRKLQI